MSGRIKPTALPGALGDFPTPMEISGYNALLLVWVLFISLTIVGLPLAETIIESQELDHAHPHNVDVTDSEPHEHGNHSCPESTNTEAPCPCLCCPGHMVALEPISFSSLSTVLNACTISTFHPVEMPLPTGVLVDVFKPPQGTSLS